MVGKEFNQAAGGAIDKSIETLADEMSEEVCGLIKKGTSNADAGLSAGAILGIVIAVIVLVLAGVLYRCCCRG